MTTPLGPGAGHGERMTVLNASGAAIPRGYAVELDTAAVFAANKFLTDSLDYDEITVQAAVAGTPLGVTVKALADGERGEIVCKGLVQCHADDTIVADDPVVIISGGKMDNEGGTGIHSDAFFGTWLAAVVAENLGLAFVWFSPLPRIGV